MIDFDKELNKYHESTEIDSLAEVINTKDTSDLTDTLIKLFREAGVSE